MSDAAQPYRVLARKYRPTTFAGLVGQPVLVRTLANALASGRIAQAFVLTGVRGVGKTTTARIIARALNCIGPDGKGSPTPEPCGVCEHCTMIADDRHIDVLELDAASRTGVAEMRELIDGVRYAPVSARYKVYIIDEVHMLSTQAFNALLKTLEEPPPHVVFVFATTEVRKIPITVLSRCQRFDLRRLDMETMVAHLGGIATKESATIEPDALRMLARAADGSVRDGLSLLDQAIALGNATISAAMVSDMLGLADRGQVLDLLDVVFAGDAKTALAKLGAMAAAGADPIVVVQDLLELVHWLTRLKIVADAAEDLAVAEAMRTHGQRMAGELGMPVLARAWQMLIKGLSEARIAPSPLTAVEMLLVRLAYVADLPTPADLVRQGDSGRSTAPPPSSAPAPRSDSPPRSSGGGGGGGYASEAALDRRREPAAPAAPSRPTLALKNFEEVVALFETKREALLATVLIDRVHLVKFEDGYIELKLNAGVPTDFLGSLKGRLEEWTGRRWGVTVSSAEGAPTLREQREQRNRMMRDAVMDHPLVKTALKAFPEAQIRNVRDQRPGVVLAEPAPEEMPGEDGGNDTREGE